MTVMVLRAAVTSLAMAALIAASYRPFLPPPGLRLASVLLGAVFVTGATSYVTAIALIKIGLAVSIFFLFPLLVAATAHLVMKERLSAVRLGAVILGFAGVALAVGAAAGEVDWRGVGLAFLAACAVAVTTTGGAAVIRRSNSITLLFAMQATGLGLLLATIAAVGAHLPVTASGWAGLLGASLMFALSSSCFYTAIGLIGPVRAAVICNLEPVAATAIAFLVLGEALAPVQLLGMALVIGAILMMQLGDRRAAQG
jgi:drug/metabolite transporter (DMT)-like permease